MVHHPGETIEVLYFPALRFDIGNGSHRIRRHGRGGAVSGSHRGGVSIELCHGTFGYGGGKPPIRNMSGQLCLAML